jgi:hypothetical protein
MSVYPRFLPNALRDSKPTPQAVQQKGLITNTKGPDTGQLWAPDDSQSVNYETLDQKCLPGHSD